jgi:hypothetical protein
VVRSTIIFLTELKYLPVMNGTFSIPSGRVHPDLRGHKVGKEQGEPGIGHLPAVVRQRDFD